MNSISRLCLCLRGTSLSFNMQLDTIFEKKIFENFANKFFVENNILNAKLIALHHLKMQGQCVYTDLRV